MTSKRWKSRHFQPKYELNRHNLTLSENIHLPPISTSLFSPKSTESVENEVADSPAMETIDPLRSNSNLSLNTMLKSKDEADVNISKKNWHNLMHPPRPASSKIIKLQEWVEREVESQQQSWKTSPFKKTSTAATMVAAVKSVELTPEEFDAYILGLEAKISHSVEDMQILKNMSSRPVLDYYWNDRDGNQVLKCLSILSDSLAHCDDEEIYAYKFAKIIQCLHEFVNALETHHFYKSEPSWLVYLLYKLSSIRQLVSRIVLMAVVATLTTSNVEILLNCLQQTRGVSNMVVKLYLTALILQYLNQHLPKSSLNDIVYDLITRLPQDDKNYNKVIVSVLFFIISLTDRSLQYQTKLLSSRFEGVVLFAIVRWIDPETFCTVKWHRLLNETSTATQSGNNNRLLFHYEMLKKVHVFIGKSSSLTSLYSTPGNDGVLDERGIINRTTIKTSIAELLILSRETDDLDLFIDVYVTMISISLDVFGVKQVSYLLKEIWNRLRANDILYLTMSKHPNIISKLEFILNRIISRESIDFLAVDEILLIMQMLGGRRLELAYSALNRLIEHPIKNGSYGRFALELCKFIHAEISNTVSTTRFTQLLLLFLSKIEADSVPELLDILAKMRGFHKLPMITTGVIAKVLMLPSPESQSERRALITFCTLTVPSLSDNLNKLSLYLQICSRSRLLRCNSQAIDCIHYFIGALDEYSGAGSREEEMKFCNIILYAINLINDLHPRLFIPLIKKLLRSFMWIMNMDGLYFTLVNILSAVCSLPTEMVTANVSKDDLNTELIERLLDYLEQLLETKAITPQHSQSSFSLRIFDLSLSLLERVLTFGDLEDAFMMKLSLKLLTLCTENQIDLTDASYFTLWLPCDRKQWFSNVVSSIKSHSKFNAESLNVRGKDEDLLHRIYMKLFIQELKK